MIATVGETLVPINRTRLQRELLDVSHAVESAISARMGCWAMMHNREGVWIDELERAAGLLQDAESALDAAAIVFRCMLERGVCDDAGC